MRSFSRLFATYTSGSAAAAGVSPALLQKLNHDLMLQSFLTSPSAHGEKDFAMFKQLKTDSMTQKVVATNQAQYPHLVRWFEFMKKAPAPKDAKPEVAKPAKEAKAAASTEAPVADEMEGKLVLQNAVVGKVVTRFPPEASGFMHIGHAKAAFISAMLRDKYEGKMVFRFDDTNPAKEKESFEHAIEEDLAWLGIKPDIGPTFTSNYFPEMMVYCRQLLEAGKAYVDFTPVEEMRKYREEMQATPCRAHTVEKNIELWEEMIKGSEMGQKCCVRAKIDVKAVNGTMRDPTMYRVVLIPHGRTGRKFNVYPTYDFACPIIDSVEGVTHALRTTEYRDRNEQYFWFIEALNIRRPELDDYSRLNMEYTVMSKRKLTQLVDNGAVDGWDDPRFPTVRALARKGVYPEALRQFVEIQGMSKVVNLMEWNKLWAFNTKILDPSVPRFTAVSSSLHVRCAITGHAGPDQTTRLRHKKNEALGSKPIFYSNEILLETPDVELLKEGEEVTLMDWGNAFVNEIKKDAEGKIVSCSATLNLEGDVKKTKYKLSWLAASCPQTTVTCVEFDNILTVKKPDPEDPNFDKIINRNSKFSQTLIGEGVMSELKKGDKLQIERRGYYIVDSVAPLTLFAIPDGSSKINHLSAKAAAGVGKSADKPKAEGKSLEEKRAEKAAQKAAQKAAGKK